MPGREAPARRRGARSAAIALAAVLLIPASAGATALGDLAAQMQPGQWRQLSTIGLGPSILDVPGSYITNFSDCAAWDPASRQFLFVGAGHGDQSGGAQTKFIRYSDAANSWTASGVPSGMYILGHAYDQSTLANGRFLHHLYNTRDVWQYDIAADAWSRMTSYPSSYPTGTGGLAYFPEMNGLVYTDGKDKGLNNAMALFYNLGSGQWSALATNLEFGDYHTFSEYNPVHHVVLFGGGEWYQAGESRQMYKLDASGSITRLRDAPVDMGIHETIVTVDPVSGKYLVFYKDMTMYEYDIATDSWRFLGGGAGIFNAPLVSSNPISGTIATPVSTYGVTMFVRKGAYDVWLYKHGTAPSGDTTAPSAPSNVTAR